MIKPSLFLTGICVLLALLSGCAQSFDRPDKNIERSSGRDIFANSLKAHGGDRLGKLSDLNVGLSGKWPFLIRRVQPLVSDYQYRVDSQERLLVGQGVYAALYQGPAGTKKVVRSRDQIRVFYNGEESFDDDVLKSSALTADAFYLFLLGPLALADHVDKFVRLQNKVEKGRDYYRLYAELKPGFGYAESDEIILWIDTETNLTHRVNITLEGYKSTRGAHVDVTYLTFANHSGFILPVKFLERVLGPIRIKAHDWRLTGIDINRGLEFDDLDGQRWSAVAASGANSEKNP